MRTGRRCTRGAHPTCGYALTRADAVAAFERTGAGVIVLPCGAGKTVVGLAAITGQRMETLIVTSNSASLTQWRQELLAKTTLDPDEIGEYSGQRREIRPVTLVTYQMLTHRSRSDQPFAHLELLDAWLKWARRCRLQPFTKLAKTITKQRPGIEAALRNGLSNARTEQVNTQIRLITRRGFGYHSPWAVIALAMLSLGGLCPPLPGR